MTLEEKLDNFYNSAIEDASKQSQTILEEYKKSLKDIYEEHKKEALRKANITLDIETKNCYREKNKTLSTQTLDIRRILSDKTKELTKILFADVTKKLEDFMKTPAYMDLLEKQIKYAVNFAKKDEITIYINTSDEDKIPELEKRTGTSLTLSTIDFFGGTRAVINAKNILIDNSFSTKLKESKETFTL